MNRGALCAALLLAIWLGPSAVHATVSCEILWTGDGCPDGPGCWYNNGDDQAIHVYMSNDMAEQFRDCTPTTADDSISDTELRRYLWSAAALWNVQARGMPLVYEGAIPYENPEDACLYSMGKRPAVFVHHKICHVDQMGNCDSDTAAILHEISTCNDAVGLKIAGNKSQSDTCSGSSTRREHRIGSDMQAGEGALKNLVVHEFGHVLGLAHLPQSNDHHGYSVMKGGSKPHLWYYDKYCAEEVAQDSDFGGREVEYVYSDRTAGGSFTTPTTHGNTTERGIIASGIVRSSYGSPYYALYTSLDGVNRIRYGYANTNGTLNLGSTSTPHSAIHDVWTSPVFFSPLERAPSSYEANRVNYLRDEEYLDPPAQDYLRTNGSGIFNSGYDDDYRECTAWSLTSCTSWNYLYGHVPMTTAYDDVTDTSIFARVNTNRTVTTSGEIYVHRGFFFSYSDLLWKGVQVPTSNLPPPEDWDFEAKTDSPVGIACARDQQDWEYNCIIAWSDRSHPQGYVLYAFFKHTGTGISWYNDGNGPRVWKTGWPSNSVSAAFMDDTFFLTFSFDDQVIVLDNDSAGGMATSDWNYTTFSTDQLVDEPSFLYSPRTDREWAVVWTEAL